MSARIHLDVTVRGTTFQLSTKDDTEDFGQSRAYGTDLARRLLLGLVEQVSEHLDLLDAQEDQRNAEIRGRTTSTSGEDA